MWRRENLKILGLSLVTLLLGVGLYLVVFPSEAEVVAPELPSVQEPPPAPEPAPAPEFQVVDVAGTVEVKRGEAWLPVARGDRVRVTESIRTAADGRAVLRSAGGDELELRERVELGVGKLEATVTELTLTQGKVKAEAAPGTERLQINSAEAQAVGAGGGRFTVYADPLGAVTVASETGDVKVVARGRSVTVGEREQTYVAPGRAPTPPRPIPDSVFLAVSWPDRELYQRRAQVRGKARPGTTVLVNGRPAVVRPDGTFETQITLSEGKNRIAVEAESIDGKTRQRSTTVRVDTRGPPLEADADRMFDPNPQKKKR